MFIKSFNDTIVFKLTYTTMKKAIRFVVFMAFSVMMSTSCSKSDDTNITPENSQPQFTGFNKNAASLTVRIIYLVPSDKKLNTAYTDGIKNGVTQLVAYYKSQLGTNKTFHLNDAVVETVQSTHAAAWFNADNGNSGTVADYYFYTNTKNDIQALLGSAYDEKKFIYLVYVDAQGKTGAGALGFTAMPENDLLGLTGKMSEAVPRWIGGAGHELGHAFGLAHPANQNPNALMWTGYTLYPNCIFQNEDKTILNGSAFIY